MGAKNKNTFLSTQSESPVSWIYAIERKLNSPEQRTEILTAIVYFLRTEVAPESEPYLVVLSNPKIAYPRPDRISFLWAFERRKLGLWFYRDKPGSYSFECECNGDPVPISTLFPDTTRLCKVGIMRVLFDWLLHGTSILK